MAQNPVPADLMRAFGRAMQGASEYLDEQEAKGAAEFGLDGFAAEILDRLNAEGYALAELCDCREPDCYDRVHDHAAAARARRAANPLCACENPYVVCAVHP